MQKGNLKCNATDCAYNQNYECKAGRIQVSGRGAVSVEGTSCTTFLDKDNSSLVNSILGDPREKESFFNETMWDISLNPYSIPENIHPVIWENTVLENRIFLTVGFIVWAMLGLLNLQKREKFV